MIDIQKLKEHFSGEIATDNDTLAKYSHDASIFEIVPEAVVYPKNVNDVKQLIKFAGEEKAAHPDLSITARSAGTCMSGGAINDSIIADFTKYFNHIIEVKAAYSGLEGQATVEPGVFYRDFETATLSKNLLLPCYTASKSLCAIGGMLANNSGGEKTLAYGKMEKYVEELWAVLADGNEYSFRELDETELEAKMRQQNFEGEVYRKVFHLIKENYDSIQAAKPNVSKNSAGYYLWNVWDKKKFNLIKLLVGSQGTLGVFTKAKLKLIRPHTHSELLVMFLNNLAPLGNVVNTVMKYKPESFESFDDHTFSLAIKFLPGLLKKMSRGAGSGSAGILNLFKLAFQFLPEAWMALTGGLPKLILIAEFAGDSEEEVAVRMKQAQADVEGTYKLKTHVTKNPAEAEKYWTVRRESFNLLRQHVKNKHTAPFVDDIVVHPADLPEFLPRLNAIFAKYPSLVYTIAGHAGDANFHIIPLMDFTDEHERAIIPHLSVEVYDLIAEFKGSITGEHNDGLVRGPFLEKMYGAHIVDLFKQVKKIFDPKDILNPHKKADATMNYLLDHIRHD